MATIKRVALAGASGNLGPAILHALLDADFDVTVLTRKNSTSSFPKASNLSVLPVDYGSNESLTSALEGQDALVSTLASVALPLQLSLFDAAEAAGVRRVIPSEFGSNTIESPSRDLPVFGHKVRVQKHLAELAAKNSDFSYTLVLTGAFFDWGLQVGLLINVKDRTAELRDGGDRSFSATNLSTIGKAVVGVLQHPEQTGNRAVKVSEVVVTQNQLIGIAEKLTGDTFKTTNFDTKEHEVQGYAALKRGDFSVMIDFIKRAVFGEGYGGEFKDVDNQLLGVKTLSEKDIEETVAKLV